MIERRSIRDRQEWLEWRRHDVTASDVGALFGLSDFKTPLQLWSEKARRGPEPVETPLMRRGRWLEPAVLCALQERMPAVEVVRPGIYVRDADIRLGATPDAIAGPYLVEAKVVSAPVFDAWQGEIPHAYHLQALAGAMLMDAAKALVACLVIDTKTASLELFHVERSEAIENDIRVGVREFWQSIAEGIMPAADYAEDLALLKSLYQPRQEAPPIDLAGDNRLPEILLEDELLRIDIRAKGERRDAIAAEVIDKLQGAPKAVCGDWRISNTLVHRKEHFVAASSYSQLRISRKKEAAA